MNKWAEDELERVDLGDERLNARSKKILSEFFDRPSSSVNGSFSGWQESKAAYRFLIIAMSVLIKYFYHISNRQKQG